MRHLLIIPLILACIGVSCKSKVPPVKARVMMDTITDGYQVVEFTDKQDFIIECFYIETDGTNKKLWQEELTPNDDGLGNTIFIIQSDKITFSGRGNNLFGHEFDPNGKTILSHYGGRNSSITQGSVFWSGYITDKTINPFDTPFLPESLADISSYCKDLGVSGLAMTASLKNLPTNQ